MYSTEVRSQIVAQSHWRRLPREAKVPLPGAAAVVDASPVGGPVAEPGHHGGLY